MMLGDIVVWHIGCNEVGRRSGMQNVIVEKPYRFAAPYTGQLWPKVLGWIDRKSVV